MADKIEKSLQSIKDKVKSPVLVYPQKLEDWIKGQGNTLDAITQGHVAFVRFKLKRSVVKTVKVDEAKITEAEKEFKEGKSISNTSEQGDSITSIEPPIQEIILPIRPIDDSLSGNWTAVEGLALLQQSFGKYLGWKFIKSMSGVASRILPQEVMVAFKQGILGSSIDNPHEVLLYSGTNRRTFEIAYEFLKPESEEDEKRLVAILDTFRACSIGSYGEYVISPPPTLDVEFISLPGYNNFLRYTNCGIQNCSVTFGGAGDQFNAMESGLPFASIALQFGELFYPTHDKLTLSDNSKIRFK